MKKNGIREIAFTLEKLILGSLLVALCPAGVLAGDGVVALQTADPSCRDGSTATYVDCGNGTVTDNRTGLVWLANVNCLDFLDWSTAMESVAGLADLDDGFCATGGETAAECDCGLSDGSSPGEWRLPSASEWEAMLADAQELVCEPRITNDLGTSCWSASCNTLGLCAFSGVQPSGYWSSTTFVNNPSLAWEARLVTDGGSSSPAGSKDSNNLVSFSRIVGMTAASVSTKSKAGINFVWPVRGGQ